MSKNQINCSGNSKVVVLESINAQNVAFGNIITNNYHKSHNSIEENRQTEVTAKADLGIGEAFKGFGGIFKNAFSK